MAAIKPSDGVAAVAEPAVATRPSGPVLAPAQARLVAGAATVLALAVRLFRLDGQSLWLDEALTYLNSETSLRQLIVDPVVDPNIPPLYYVLIHGVLELGQGEIALRLPSVLAGTLTVPLVFLLARRWLGDMVAAVAALLLAISPFHVWYSQEARPYALLLFLGVAAIWLLERVRDNPDRRGERIGFVLVAAATFYCHTIALPFLVMLGVYALGTAPPAERRHWMVTFVWIVVVCVPALLRLVLIPPTTSANTQYQFDPTHVGYTFWTFATGFSLGPNLIELRTQGLASVREHGRLIAAASLIVGVLLLIGARYLARATPSVRAIISAWLLVPVGFAVVGALVTKHPFNVRYAILAFPPFVIILAAGVAGLRAPIARSIGGLALVAVCGAALANYFGDPAYQREDNRGVAAYLRAHARPGDLVIASAGYTLVPLQRYALPAPLDLVPYPGPRRRTGPVAPGEPPSLSAQFVQDEAVAADLDAIIGDHEGFWVFLSRTFHSDPRGLIRRYLDDRYRAERVYRSAGVELIRYVRPIATDHDRMPS